MKILLLSDPACPHTIKWARSLADQGHDIFIFGLSKYDPAIYNSYNNIELYTLDVDAIITRSGEGNLSKLRYFKAIPKLKKVIKNFKPDILHAHYATSYGLLGSLSGFHPFILSVWGTDVFDFPRKSILHRYLLKFNFYKADKILSTSNIMAVETNKYTAKKIEVTPFGIDLNIFKPMLINSFFKKEDIVIGTVKTLEEKYGVEYLVRAFKFLSDKHSDLPLKLLIVGGGSKKEYLEKLTRELSIDNKTIFAGKVPYDEVQRYHNMLSISVSVSISNSESFGVAIIEASACGKPVIVSRIGGLPEVVDDGVTGIIVQPENAEETASAIERLILNDALMQKMGEQGRKFVSRLYCWDDNVIQMCKIYDEIFREFN